MTFPGDDGMVKMVMRLTEVEETTGSIAGRRGRPSGHERLDEYGLLFFAENVPGTEKSACTRFRKSRGFRPADERKGEKLWKWYHWNRI